jgi:hypothetical protein
MRDVQNITKMEGSVDKLLNESDKMIKEFIGRLEIMRDYCQSRIDEISEVCLGNLKNKDVWKFVINEARLASVNLFNMSSDYAYILSFFEENKEITDKIIKFDIETDKYIQKYENSDKRINTISNSICSSEYMYKLFNEAGKIEFEKTVDRDKEKREEFVFDSTLIVLDYFKALELYLMKKIYVKFRNEDKICEDLKKNKFFTGTMGKYIEYIKHINFNEKLIKELNQIKNNYRNSYAHKCYLVKDSETTEIRLKIRELIVKLDKEFDKYEDKVEITDNN